MKGDLNKFLNCSKVIRKNKVRIELNFSVFQGINHVIRQCLEIIKHTVNKLHYFNSIFCKCISNLLTVGPQVSYSELGNKLTNGNTW